MILAESYSKEWINEKKPTGRGFDLILIEQIIFAFTLVERLVICGMDFIFKGGTCLNLLLGNPRRLSIDVDILTEESRKTIEDALKDICSNSVFTRYDIDKNRSYMDGIPKAHYHLFYHSEIENRERSIMLDILNEGNHYFKTQKTPLKSKYLKTNSDNIYVTTPTIDSITGDKLTAFAPNTTGIRYNSGKQLQIMKQLFDLGELYENITDIRIIHESFNKIAENELEYRKLSNKGSADVLEDIIETSLLIATMGVNLSEENKKKYDELSSGVQRLRGYVVRGNFTLHTAILYSSKIALLAARLKRGDYSQLIHYDNEDISQLVFINQNKYIIPIRQLRGIPGGALFYWHNTVSTLVN